MKPELIHRLERDDPPQAGPYAERRAPEAFTCPFCGATRAPHAPHCGVAIPPLLASGPERLHKPTRFPYQRYRARRRNLAVLFFIILGWPLPLMIAAGEWWGILPLVGVGFAIALVLRTRTPPHARRRRAPVDPRSPRRSVTEILRQER